LQPVHEAVIEAEGIGFRYVSEPVLDNVSFTVNEGDYVCIIGSNGAGKSTLLRLVLGELAPLSGSIRLFGEDVRHFRGWPQIGYLPQNGFRGSAFPATAEEIVTANQYAAIGRMRFPKKEHREKTRDALAQVGMQDYAKRLFGELSGGQQQRVLLARMLVNDPRLMILDEPTTGVDRDTVQSLYELLYACNRERNLTIVMVTHDVGRAEPYVSRVLCLEDGSLLELEKSQIDEELSHKHKHPPRCGEGGEAHARV